MRDIEIIDNIESLDDAKQYMSKYGKVKDMIDLHKNTEGEVTINTKITEYFKSIEQNINSMATMIGKEIGTQKKITNYV